MADITDKIKQADNFVSLAGVDKTAIKDAEEFLNLKFADDYKKCLAAFGVFSANGHEITGICKSKRLNVTDVTTEQKENNLLIPENLYVIEVLGIDGIVVWQDKKGVVYSSSPNQKPVKICDSLESYIKL